MIRERGEDLPRESCFGFVVMVVISCWRFLEVRRKVRGEKPNLRVFYFCYPRDATIARRLFRACERGWTAVLEL